MSQPDQPRIYLISPAEVDLAHYPALLTRILDAHEIACLRLALASRDEDHIARIADACREVTHARDVALVIDTHLMLVPRLGLDGVHLPDGSRHVRAARKSLGPDAIVGGYCGASRHDGMSAAEAGADYVSFGPAGLSTLGDGSQAGRDLFEWWSEMIEVPVVAEGALDPARIADLAPVTDFFGIGEEIWREDDPVAALAHLLAPLG